MDRPCKKKEANYYYIIITIIIEDVRTTLLSLRDQAGGHVLINDTEEFLLLQSIHSNGDRQNISIQIHEILSISNGNKRLTVKKQGKEIEYEMVSDMV